MVVFKRFVEAGRLCLITYGPDAGKMCIIVDILDQNRVIVDGPTTGVERQQMPLRWVTLTDFKIDIQRGSKSGLVKKVIESSHVFAQWSKTAWAQKLQARVNRRQLDDFGRFKAMVLKKRKAHRVRTELNKLKTTKKVVSPKKSATKTK